uniref:Claudin n=1 Tax=Chromera velia CCMP2878 TaxID=1169474 RepID=A0A0G4HP32_9ALVE|eukprot:Cvel_7783.t1-p1 / transcript=Cvel_7783.t1 / gene=Cvel_7783 / organism=Chromera_velia_CCMP2878 / gene_product=hypothetical protein / transcript_product=hypothetical protein / location=Cvel_scaffold414:88385-90417(-) / protein_length=248 / sequence_SO=supercontig / SO=protein_coding / is_pseudo=false
MACLNAKTCSNALLLIAGIALVVSMSTPQLLSTSSEFGLGLYVFSAEFDVGATQFCYSTEVRNGAKKWGPNAGCNFIDFKNTCNTTVTVKLDDETSLDLPIRSLYGDPDKCDEHKTLVALGWGACAVAAIGILVGILASSNCCCTCSVKQQSLWGFIFSLLAGALAAGAAIVVVGLFDWAQDGGGQRIPSSVLKAGTPQYGYSFGFLCGGVALCAISVLGHLYSCLCSGGPWVGGARGDNGRLLQQPV